MTVINYVMRLMHKILFNLGLLVAVLILFYAFYLREDTSKDSHHDVQQSTTSNSNDDEGRTVSTEVTQAENKHENVNLWCIFTKVDKNSNLKYKFEVFAKSVINKATKPIDLSIITDENSKSVAEEIILGVQSDDRKFNYVSYLDVAFLADRLKRLVSIMSPHFSSRPGTYYSDALFFLSLGLHHIVNPNDEQRIIMTDVDIKVVGDIAELWSEFDNFDSDDIFGLGPELSPVYRHVFHTFRAKNPGSTVGEPLSENGYPGVNSGVILLDLERMRQSKIYSKFIGDEEPNELNSGKEENNVETKGRVASVEDLVKKYSFRGHLGDQDFYTLLGAEYPELIRVIPCVWNRQLCTWWGDRGGYGDVFDKYFKCDGKIKIYHGNCNSPFPKDSD